MHHLIEQYESNQNLKLKYLIDNVVRLSDSWTHASC
jgi:hypothetical protein